MLKVTKWYTYFVNGYRFHTKEWSHGKTTINYRVCVKGFTDREQDDFYGIIHQIYDFHYHGLSKPITFFYCE